MKLTSLCFAVLTLSDALTADGETDEVTDDGVKSTEGSDDVTRQALQNVKKIFENLQREGGRDQAVEYEKSPF